MTTPPPPTPKGNPLNRLRNLLGLVQSSLQPKERKPWGLFKTVMLGLAASLFALGGAMWLFAYQATLNKPAWTWIPPIEPNEMFEVIRNAVTAVAALGIGVTLFLSYRKQRTVEEQLQATRDANANAVEALNQAKIEHRDAVFRATLDREATNRQNTQNHQATQDALNQTNQSLTLAREQSASDAIDKLRARYSSAAEQIGSSNASLAAAGIISMASVADEWHKMGRSSDRDDCIRMLVAGLPGPGRPKDDATIIRSTCRSIFDQRMTNLAGDDTNWWKAGFEFTTTGADFGHVRGWVFEGSRVKIRCSQLNIAGTSVVQDITITGGLLEITFHNGEEHVLIQNADIQKGGIDIQFGGPTPNSETKVVFSVLKSNGGRIKFEEPNQPSLKRVLIFKDCEFTSPTIALPSFCENYQIIFDRCSFMTNPFIHYNNIRGGLPTIDFKKNNYVTHLMANFPHDSPEELFNPQSNYFSPEEDEQDPSNPS